MNYNHIVCISNASKEVHPHNTLTKFRNVLSSPIINTERKLCAALQTICVSSQFEEGSYQPKYIAVRVRHITQLIDDGQVLYVLPNLQKYTHNNAYYFEVLQKEYFKIDVSIIRELEFDLVDDRGFQLQLRRGQPTIIKLDCRVMDNPDEVIRLSSDMSNREYSDNTPASFRVHLPSRLMLRDGQWQVALSSIHFPLLDNQKYEDLPNIILLYADIVEQTYVGSVAGSLLKLLPLHQDEHSAANHYESQHLNFMTIEDNSIVNIKFDLHDMAGNPISFRAGGRTIISMILRNKKA